MLEKIVLNTCLLLGAFTLSKILVGTFFHIVAKIYFHFHPEKEASV